MLTLNDGRAELWQWDTGRTLAVDADCSQVHFSNKVFGRSIDVDVVNGTAIIPDILLQTDNDLNVWAFVGTAENGYTKISKMFTVNRRNKPADYVFTPTDQMTLQTIHSQIGDLDNLTTEAKDTLVAAINEAARTGGGISSDAVLYTPQTLTDAQKKQARENVDAASIDFVITGTVTGETLTTDKTYEQVHEAVHAGKRVTLKVEAYGIDLVLPLIGENSSGYLFTTAATVFPTVTRQFSAVVGASGTLWHTEQVASYDSNGNLVQIFMDRDPEQPMEIATKQYVDASGVPSGGSSDFVINGTKHEDEPVVLDKTFAQIKEAVQSGKRAIVQMTSDGNVTIMPLIVNQSRLLLFSSMYNTGGQIFGISLIVTSSNVTEYFISTPTNNPDGTMPQVSMAADPTADMQIATKRYVDDGLAKKAPEGDYVTNSALNEKGYLTLDTLPKYGGETA